ncbi:hypothetical protein [Bradyrhizobium sp. RT10b]|uniref:ImmA/IrrE family metallo-endopeptidase n=1 Tax=Bradyrhizobium sp. RT10b TaxID=3156331 RepID=UPI00339108BD
MSLPDDSSVASDQLAEIRAAADRLLREGGALGCFPTPVDQIMHAAKVEIVPLQLDDGYLDRLRQKAEAAGTALLSALSKVWGIFDPKARVAFIDPETPKNKLPFLKLHEGGHAVLPWQSIFGIFEDCRKTLDPDVKAQFEREANVFASEVLFQRNTFTVEARDLAVGLKAPLILARRYGASVYATVRRYVSTSDRACAVLVYDPPIVGPTGAVSMLRRAVTSSAFDLQFGAYRWPGAVTPADQFGSMVPVRRMTNPRSLALTDANGDRRRFIAEAFRTPHQTFVLLHADPRPIRGVVLPSLVAPPYS